MSSAPAARYWSAASTPRTCHSRGLPTRMATNSGFSDGKGVLMTPTKEQTKLFYAQTAERCLKAYTQLDKKDWAKKASDHWTAKQHLAYTVGALEEQQIPVTRAAIGGEPIKLRGFEAREDESSFRRSITEKVQDLPV